jgi:hypothetical protein
MRIVTAHTTPDHFRLVLTSSYWSFGAGCALCMAAGAVVMWLMANDIALIVEGGEFRYTRRFIGAFIFEEVVFSATQIRSVGLEVVTALGGVSRSYEVTLAGPNGVWRPWLVMADGDIKRAMVDGIQKALADASQRYEYTETGTVPGLILGGTLICGGLYLLAFIQAIVIAGNRQEGSVVVARRRLLLPGGAQRTLAIADIVRCKAEASNFHTTRGHRVTTYQVVLQVLDEGDREDVPLSFGPAFTQSEATTLARTINSWLVNARRTPQRPE